jgi:hypothetical protein
MGKLTATDFDTLAAEALAVEMYYAPGEWAAIEAVADALVEEARTVGVDPRAYAGTIMQAVAASVDEDAPFDEDDDLARVDRAIAAALVYVGRIT